MKYKLIEIVIFAFHLCVYFLAMLPHYNLLLKDPISNLCRNVGPAAGCFLQHQCIPGILRAGFERPISGHEVMRQLLVLSQVYQNC